jgi:hypothetical protein
MVKKSAATISPDILTMGTRFDPRRGYVLRCQSSPRYPASSRTIRMLASFALLADSIHRLNTSNVGSEPLTEIFRRLSCSALRLALVLICTNLICTAAEPVCAVNALTRAKLLLTFHSGPDQRMTIDKTVTRLPPLRNPENPKQKFEVLEVWGEIYKARYRMHLIYYNSASTRCLLMGEEILEFAVP